MREWALGHGQHGFELHIAEVPWWAKAVESGYGTLLMLAGHPCCDAWPSGRWTVWGWLRNHIVPAWPTWTRSDGEDEWESNPRDALSVVQFWLLNHPVAHFGYRHEKNRHTVPVSDRVAKLIDAEWVAEMNEMFPPSERPVFSSTLCTQTTLTWTIPPSADTPKAG